ncbi:MAG: hypothetical protein AAGL24_01720 [Pseudomonadota bacterium]
MAALAATGMLAAAVTFAGPADAQTALSVDAGAMSCAALKQTVRENGAVTVYSVERFARFNLAERLVNRRSFSDRRAVDRYVKHRGFCFYNEVIQFQSVTTRDSDQCWLRVCGEPPGRNQNR